MLHVRTTTTTTTTRLNKVCVAFFFGDQVGTPSGRHVVACCMAITMVVQRGDAVSAVFGCTGGMSSHSRDVGPVSHFAPRSQKTARAGKEEEDVVLCASRMATTKDLSMGGGHPVWVSRKERWTNPAAHRGAPILDVRVPQMVDSDLSLYIVTWSRFSTVPARFR